MADTGKTRAQTALFEAIETAAKDQTVLRQGAQAQAAYLKNLAAAYRLAAGGAQPGSSDVTS